MRKDYRDDDFDYSPEFMMPVERPIEERANMIIDAETTWWDSNAVIIAWTLGMAALLVVWLWFIN